MNEQKKIAIIGGGASGLISGYLLHKNHEITVYEKEAVLGGNVRTLNKNVPCPLLSQGINIENGVLGFSQTYYPCFHKLLHHLGTGYTSYKPSVSLFYNNLYFPASSKAYLSIRTLRNALFRKGFLHSVLQLNSSRKSFENQVAKSSTSHLVFEDYSFTQALYKTYIQALFMLSFSTPLSQVGDLPQSLLNPYFLSLPNSQWSFIKGGVYTYMQALLDKSNMQIICNAKGLQVYRKADGVVVQLGAEKFEFDKVIIATTPGSVKNVLGDISEKEKEIFNNWNDRTFKTTAHKDLSVYGTYRKVKKTPMDLFHKFRNDESGYNTYQNTAYGLETKEHYSFAYNLDKYIAREAIIDEACHTVPCYTKSHDQKTNLLRALNGQQNTWFAGAYLGSGLHEGAVQSAMMIASKLGGIKL